MGFEPYDYRKESYGKWKDKVDSELLHLHIEMAAVAAKLNNAKLGQADRPSSERVSGQKEGYIPTDQRLPFQSQPSDSLTGKLPFASASGQEYLRGDMESEGGYTTDDLVHSTYAIHEATHAMRGYLMLIDQMGLSKDQKKMVRDLEYLMMLITKLTMAISIVASLLAAPSTLGLSALLPLFVAGGMSSASLAYGMKLTGGQV